MSDPKPFATNERPTAVGRYIDLYRELCGTTPLLNNQECEVIERLVSETVSETGKPERSVPFYACEHGTPGGCAFCNATAKPWERHPIRTLHACVETLASAFKGFLPWADEHRGQTVRGHEMLIEDTLKRADACMTIIEHGARTSSATVTPKGETPRTDAIRTIGSGGKCRDWKEERTAALALCRQLERELAESRANADDWMRKFGSTQGHSDTPSATRLPKSNDGKEQAEFEAWAKRSGYEMQTHPLHWLFLDKRTYAAREGWRSALEYVERVMREEGYVDGSQR